MKKENFAQVSRLPKRMIILSVQHSPKHVMIIFLINKIHEGLIQNFQWYVTNRSDFQNHFMTYSMIYHSAGKLLQQQHNFDLMLRQFVNITFIYFGD